MASGTVPGSAMHLTRTGTKGWMSGLVRTWQRAIPVSKAPLEICARKEESQLRVGENQNFAPTSSKLTSGLVSLMAPDRRGT